MQHTEFWVTIAVRDQETLDKLVEFMNETGVLLYAKPSDILDEDVTQLVVEQYSAELVGCPVKVLVGDGKTRYDG